MKYSSTRGNSPSVSFINVLTSGVAPDGGLYIPEVFPRFLEDEIKELKNLSYQDLARNIIYPFLDDFLTNKELEEVINDAYSSFRSEEVVELIHDKNIGYILELFHGPTFAFKDVAMQLLAGLLNKASEKIDKKIVILGATSGDTGSAAIEACKRYIDIDIFILFPNKKISEVQQKQMTTSGSANVFPIAINGDFDDCQDHVKKLFLEQSSFSQIQFVSINSINWTRIMAQSVYFFYTRFKLDGSKFIASIPSGNFGHAYAGWCAKKMGLDIDGIHIATNKNDILHRLISSNFYKRENTQQSLAPSMDISVASNFERLLYDIFNENKDAVNKLMTNFPENQIDLNKNHDGQSWKLIKDFFISSSSNDQEIISTIVESYEDSGIIFDPHTATAINGNKKSKLPISDVVSFATAHPGKFPEAIESHIKDFDSHRPEQLVKIMKKKESYDILDKNYISLKEFIKSKYN